MRGSFVFIFRQVSRKLSEEEQQRRTDEVRVWALEQLKDGRNFDPRVLGDESYRLEDSTVSANSDGRSSRSISSKPPDFMN